MPDELKRIFNDFDPLLPASPRQYTHTSAARGTAGSVTKDFVRRVRLCDGKHVRFAFSGHIGCGKSSELHHLRQELLNGNANVSCFPVLIDANEYLADYDADANDLLLVIVAEVAAALRSELGIHLQATYFDRLFDGIKSALFSKVEVTEAEVDLPGLTAKLTRMKKDKTARDEVRNAVAAQVNTVLDEMNLLFERARIELVQSTGGKFKDLVLLIDNLDKIQKVANNAEGLASFKEIFLEQAPKLTGFDAHVVYTVPLELVRSIYATQMLARYERLVVLPMIKVETRDGQPHHEGLALMRDLVQRRIGIAELAKAITADALDYLLSYCGGHTRHLVQFIRFAIVETDSLPIRLPAARAAVQDLALAFSTSIPEDHWRLLAELQKSTDRKIPNGDPQYLALLESLAILEYMNGDTDDDDFAEPWYAVHPIVRRLQKFKEALKAQDGV